MKEKEKVETGGRETREARRVDTVVPIVCLFRFVSFRFTAFRAWRGRCELAEVSDDIILLIREYLHFFFPFFNILNDSVTWGENSCAKEEDRKQHNTPYIKTI